VLSLTLAAPAAALEQRLTAADGAMFDNFGQSVAVAGDTVVVGAPNAAGRGSVYIFTRAGDSWTQSATLTASDGSPGDRLGESVTVAGDIIVAGAIGADSNRGAVYTFARTGAAARTETARLTASDGAGLDRLGVSVAVAGETIVAGAARADVGGNVDRGAVYTFARTGATARTETAKLTASDGTRSAALGISVAITGDTIVAGAHLAQTGGLLTGAVYTFTRTGAPARTETAKLTASDGAAGDSLGEAVAAAGETIVAGAPLATTTAGPVAGAVYTFAAAGAATRTETAKLTASDGTANARLGGAVAVADDAIAAGAPFAEAVYTFARTGAAARTETGKLTDDAGLVGRSVAASDDTIVAGAPFAPIGPNQQQGSATVYFSPPPPPDPRSGPSPTVGPAAPGPAPHANPEISGLRLGSRCVRATRSGRVRVRMRFRLARPGPVQIRVARAIRPRVKVVRRCPRPNPRRVYTGGYRSVKTLRRVSSRPAAAAAAMSRRLTLTLRLAPGLYRITVRAQLEDGRLSVPVQRDLRVLNRSSR
jgi:FG-GAP repeat protein